MNFEVWTEIHAAAYKLRSFHATSFKQQHKYRSTHALSYLCSCTHVAAPGTHGVQGANGPFESIEHKGKPLHLKLNVVYN